MIPWQYFFDDCREKILE